MGRWSSDILGDDESLDIAGDFTDLIAEGLTPEQATTELERRWQPGTGDDGPSLFWLALAAVQVETGRLTDRTKNRALQCLAGDFGLAGYSANDRPARRKALQVLKSRLTGPHRKPTPIQREIRHENSWAVGTILSWKTGRGTLRLLRVADHLERKQGRYPIVQILEGEHNYMPSHSHIRSLRALLDRDNRKRLTLTLLPDFETNPRLAIGPLLPPRWIDRLLRLAPFRAEPKFEQNLIPLRDDLDSLLETCTGDPW